ncbi:hypothetical protein LCGC14_2633900 [marine sediment metagenome]|uniref:Uncharacterized protein n=1 Tax=marine sediment metagenome TaxID=412755 RepID=A0A0F9CRV6_9ZZZZ
MEDFALMGCPVMDVRVFIEPRRWVPRLLRRWLGLYDVRLTWIECTDEVLQEFTAAQKGVTDG